MLNPHRVADDRTRFVYRCVVQQDDKTVEALTLVSLLGQGVSDIIVFGLIERR